MAIHVFDIARDGVQTPIISRDARLVVGPHTGARTATLNYVVLEPGEGNQPHEHPQSEDCIFILEGRGRVADLTNGVTLPIGPECAVFVPAGIRHTVECTGPERMVSVGGPCPPDWAMLEQVGIAVKSRSGDGA